MDSPKLQDEEAKRNNGELSPASDADADSDAASPVIRSAPSDSIINGNRPAQSPSSAPVKTAAENKAKPLKKWRRIRRDFTKALSLSPDFAREGSPGSGRDLPDDLIQHKRRIPLPDSSRNGPGGDAAADDEKDEFDDVEGESSVASVESRNTGLNEATNFVASPVVSSPDQEAPQLMINAPIFSIGAVDPETSEDRSSKSSIAASAPRSRRENLFGRDRNNFFKGSSGFAANQRAPRGRVMETSKKTQLNKIEPENSNSNSNAVSNGKLSDKSVNYDGGENSDEGIQGEEVRSAYCRENGETGNSNPADLDSRFEEGKNGGFEIPDLDPLVLIQASQEALETELEKWSGIGKEEEMEEESEEIEWSNSPDTNFEIQELNSKINQLKLKLLEASNSSFQRDYLNQTLIQSEFDQLFQEKFESEIQTLVITKTVLKWERTLQDSKAFVEEQKSLITEHRKLNLNLRELENNQVVLKTHSEKLEDELKEKSEKLEILDAKNEMFNTSFVYFVELVLIGLMVVMFLMSLLPGSSDVVPT
ncbi:hypothetical protein LUZ60_003301 [Juncus effusus]|nr:hypothetical protein LUZ60_003301 [Juncus effusus]